MFKPEVISIVSQKAEVSKKDTKQVIDALLEAIVDSLSNGEPVCLNGFGKFSLRQRKAHIGRNPSTGEEISIEAKGFPAFKPSQSFKDAVK